MKKTDIFKFKYATILVLLLLGSCQDVLNVVPTDRLDVSRILSKQGNIIEFRNNCYDQLNGSMTDQSLGQLLDVYTDDAFRAGTGTYYDWHNNLLNPINSFMAASIWNESWQGIRKCNLAFEYMPQSTVSKELVPDEQITQWLDEVKILRAWYHFVLIRNFGPIPFIDKVFDVNFTGWNELKRPSYDEISSRLVAELDEVIAGRLLPLRWQSSEDYFRMNRAVAYALKSRILLYNASLLNNAGNDQTKWQKAASAAQECISALGSEYSLVAASDYDKLFNESVNVLNKEIILRANENSTVIMNSNNGVDLKLLGSATQSSNCGAVPTQELVDCFELADGSLPVTAYNADHTSASFSGSYNENAGTNPYVGRDMRLQSSIVFNTTKYGKYKGQAVSAPELVIYTYEGKPGTGFNINTTSQLESEKRLSCTGYYLRKFNSASYWGSTTGGTSAHKIFFRLAEIYLNLAEANCELNKLDEAITALNVVRTRAGQPSIATVPGFAKTKDSLMKRIRNERRVELCFEGHRFFDQRRWKILDQTNGIISGMKITSATGTDKGDFSYERVKIETVRNATSDKYLVLPIPQEEARRLTGLGQPEAWQ